MKIKVTTETGSFYHINLENGRWVKNASPYDRHHRITVMRAGDYEDRTPCAFEGGGTWEDVEFPIVGKCLYIGSSLFEWYVSTPVVNIELNPADWDSEYLDMD